MNRLFPLLAILVAVGALGGAYWYVSAHRPRPDVVAGKDDWLYPGWEKLADERGAATRQGVDLAVQIDRLLKARGERLVILLMPNKGRVTPEHLSPAELDRVTRSKGYERLAADLKARGLTVLDAMPTLQATHRATGKAYQPRDAHWTGAAAEAVADQLAALVRSLGPVPGQAGEGERLAPWREVRRYADLVDIQRRHGGSPYGQDVFILRDYTAPPTGPAAILVIGNSFVDRQYGLPQRLSSDLDRKVVDQIRYAAEGPWDAMGDYLQGKGGAQAKIVVFGLGEDSFSSGPAQQGLAAYLTRRKG